MTSKQRQHTRRRSRLLVAVVAVVALAVGCSPSAEDLEATAVKACQQAVEKGATVERWVSTSSYGDPPDRVTGMAALAGGSFSEVECTIAWDDDRSEATATVSFMS